jgi:hypothetical protein
MRLFMATIRKRGRRWQALVRLKGALPISKSFDRRAEAETWARRQETAIDSDESIERVRLGLSSELTLVALPCDKIFRKNGFACRRKLPGVGSCGRAASS